MSPLTSPPVGQVTKHDSNRIPLDITHAQTEPSVVKFYRQYLQQIDDVTYPPSNLLVYPDVQDVLFRYCFDDSRYQYLPPPRYRVKILKRLIQDIENECQGSDQYQVSDELMEHMALLHTIPQQDATEAAQQMSVHAYFPPFSYDQEDAQPILIKEARNVLVRGNNVGLRTWEASLRLACYLFSRPELVANKGVIELGAGTGLLPLLCTGFLGAHPVLATDGLAQVLDGLQTNIGLNQHLFRDRTQPAARLLDWTEPLELQAILPDFESLGKFEMILGADITYSPTILQPLAELLGLLVDRYPGIDILISATIRNVETMRRFFEICELDLHFTVKRVPFDPGQQTGFFHSVATEIAIYTLWRVPEGCSKMEEMFELKWKSEKFDFDTDFMPSASPGVRHGKSAWNGLSDPDYVEWIENRRVGRFMSIPVKREG